MKSLLLVLVLVAVVMDVPATGKTKPSAKKNAERKKTTQQPTGKTVGSAVVVSIVTEQNQRLAVPSRMINGKIYSSISLLRNKLSPEQEDNTTLTLAGHDVRCVANGFLVTGKSKQGTRMAQMKLPALLIGKETYVPVPDFFYALDALGVYEVEATQQLIILNPFTSTLVTAQLIDSKKTYNPFQPEKVKEVVPSFPKENKEAPPSRYKLPQDLKRRELDTAKHKDGSLLIDSVGSKNLATLGFVNLKTTPNRISKVYPEVLNGITTIHFEAEKSFTEPEQPVVKGNTITVRFPGAVNGQKSLDAIRKLNFKEVKTFLDDGEQVYSFTLRKDNRTATLTKENTKHYVLIIKPTTSDSTAAKSEKKKWSLDCIVLDAGHGGKDCGTTGIDGTCEKTVALSVVKKLRNEIKKHFPETKVVLTRDDDTFIELWERGEIANKAGGKLLISIHCNSMPTKPNPANGFETYVLSPARTDDAVAVANQENSVIKLEQKSDKYKGMNDDQLILATLAQTSFVKFSQKFATLVQSEMDKTTTMHSRGVNQAAFIVLIGAAMPSVLVEIGFLSNPTDLKQLTTEKGQTTIAKGIANAVKRYSDSYKQIVK